ncbi:hypothetical protein SASPL_140602 [Salvia splendens]|uniref:peroxidase n=1 Tax=Salvia splendens TaxID=180675 RepID=A0A8X8WQ18_SALSN|nr:hypothetical protein SASPL_140602 [Salvia splendens]
MVGRFVIPIISLVVVLSSIIPCEAQLSATFYDATCPNASTIIRNSIRRAILAERRMAASLIRLHFHVLEMVSIVGSSFQHHDCFVQGCDASILLDETSTIQTEKSAGPNANSVRGYEVIEAAKRACPGVVSSADVLTLAARDASVAVGGPSWSVKLSRRDSTTANKAVANTDLPNPFSALQVLIDAFDKKGYIAMVPSTDIDAGFACTRRRGCPQTGGDSNLATLDLATPNSFDNNYFRNSVQKKGLLQSDQVLFTGSTAAIASQ